ncbi:hypothetical protein BGZ61DRAFT_237723 [Ilyonectria robusta]|uniref:uncharacterized protein n=1 Tax=Ilyonectria robusta TaxID=1079257 RepID=UPI001E8DE388|nr:uncharacterized protein BGZ61DRAFT_237723 [Ilyonectria robusta]KAH8699819.1 hypothetical protein BGZ61DRAFT_237723 [Ilyonectria robusta]
MVFSRIQADCKLTGSGNGGTGQFPTSPRRCIEHPVRKPGLSRDSTDEATQARFAAKIHITSQTEAHDPWPPGYCISDVASHLTLLASLKSLLYIAHRIYTSAPCSHLSSQNPPQPKTPRSMGGESFPPLVPDASYPETACHTDKRQQNRSLANEEKEIKGRC